MKAAINFIGLVPVLLLLSFPGVPASAQCTTWENLPDRMDLQDFYILYRASMKDKNYDLAFQYWKKVYERAPAVDGQRVYVYSDGRFLHLLRFRQAKTEEEKQAAAATIRRLHEEQRRCYPESEIEPLPKEVLEYSN